MLINNNTSRTCERCETSCRRWHAPSHPWADCGVESCMSLSDSGADINQAYLTCCPPTPWSRGHVYLRGGAECLLFAAVCGSSTQPPDCHQPFMFISFWRMAAHRSAAVTRLFVIAYYFLDVSLHQHKCSHLLFLVRNSIETCQNNKHASRTRKGEGIVYIQ